MKRYSLYGFFMLQAILYTGCPIKQPQYASSVSYIDAVVDTKEAEHIKVLEEHLRDTMHIDASEAKIIAKEAYLYPHVLAKRYALTWPPLLHNTLVNAGFKHKGLCFQWAEDFYLLYRKMHLKSVDLHWGCANQGKYSEHNSLVLTKKSEYFSKGIILDPWRNSGELFWVDVDADKKYSWHARKDLKEQLDLLDLTQKNPSIFRKR